MGSGVGAERLVDDVGQSAFQDAQGLLAAATVCFATCDEVACWLVTAGLGHGDTVQGSGELPVAGGAEPVSGAVDDQTGSGAVPLCRA
jgi:hypothetical protein